MPKTPKFFRKVREFISRTPEPSRLPSRIHLSDTTDDVRPTQSISAWRPANPAQGDVASPLGPTGVFLYSFVIYCHSTGPKSQENTMPADSYNSPRDNQRPSNEHGMCTSTLIVILSTLTVYSNLENKRISFLGWERFQAVLEQGPILSRWYPIQSSCRCHRRLN